MSQSTTKRFISKDFVESLGCGALSVNSEKFETFVREIEEANNACLISVYPCKFMPGHYTCVFDTQFGEHRKANKDMPRMQSLLIQ